MIKINMLIILFFSLQLMAQDIKVMSYNIRVDVAADGENDWAHRKISLTSQIQFYEPDVFGIQEAAPNQVNDMGVAFTNYSNTGVGREGIGKGESSNIFYKKERCKSIESGTFWLSETPDTISKGWDAAYNRFCTYTLFKDLKNKKFFWVFNTHSDHVGTLAKINGIKLILSKIRQVNKKRYPVILWEI